MAQGLQRWRLVVVFALGAATWAAFGGDDAPPSAAHPADAPRPERERPSDEEVEARRRRALLGFARPRGDEARPLEVRVLGCGRLPVERAEVSLVGEGLALGGETDARGVWRGRAVEAATVRARSGELWGEALAGPSEGAVELGLCPGATVLGKVLDHAGRPLAGALVRLVDGAGAELDLAETEQDGEVVLTDLWLMATEVVVDHPSGALARRLEPALRPHEERQLQLTLEGGRRVAGLVRTTAGAPVPNARITATDEAGHVLADTRSDPSGRFWLHRLELVPVVVRADAGPLGLAEARLDATTSTESLTLTVDARGLIVARWDGARRDVSMWASPALAPWESVSAPDDEDADLARRVALTPGREALVPAPRYWRVGWRTPDGATGTCGEGLVLPGDRLEVRCGASGRARLVAQVLGADGEPMAGRWLVFAVIGGEGTNFEGDFGPDGKLVAEIEAPHGVAASLRVDLPGHGPLQRRRIPLSPGATTDLGTLQPMSEVELESRFSREELTRPFGGVGARVQATDLGLALTALAADGPLALAGAEPGDVVFAVDGMPAGRLTTFEAVKLLRGEPGTKLRLRLMRPDASLFEVELQRALVDSQAADWLDTGGARD